MSKAELQHLQEQALSVLKEEALSSDELAQKLNHAEKDVREIVWQLVNSRRVEFTRDWKVKATDLAGVALAA